MKAIKKLKNLIGICIVRYILGTGKEGWLVTRKTGAQQVIKVYSRRAYENVIRPITHKAEQMKAGAVADILEKMAKEDRLLKESEVILAVQKAIIELGYEPLGDKQNKIYEAIEGVPTAYDVDKVVAELENMTTICSAGTIINGGYIGRNKAIDIVRKR